MKVETATVSLEMLKIYTRIVIELKDIEPESRLNQNHRCVLGCGGEWEYDDDESGDTHFQHGEFCPFTLAEKTAIRP